jgi:hypothetical protein
LPARDAGQRLDERGILVRDVRGDDERAARDVFRRQTHELREAAGIEPGRPQRLAHGVLPGAAVAARVARNVVRGDDAIAGQESREPRSDLGDLTGDLVAEHQRGLRASIPFHDVRAADSGRHDADDELAVARARHGALLEPDVVVRVVDRSSHHRIADFSCS